jgi:mxaD protein
MLISKNNLSKSTDGTGGNEKGATRVLTLTDGGTITEFLKKYDAAKMSYTYKITDMSIV